MKMVIQQYQQPKTIISPLHIASNNSIDIKIRYARFLENKYYTICKKKIGLCTGIIQLLPKQEHKFL